MIPSDELPNVTDMEQRAATPRPAAYLDAVCFCQVESLRAQSSKSLRKIQFRCGCVRCRAAAQETHMARSSSDRPPRAPWLLENSSTALLTEYLTLPEVVKAFGKHERSWYRLEEKGEGPPRTVVGKVILYRREAFMEWLRSREEHNGMRFSANGRPRKPPVRAHSSTPSARSIGRTRNARRVRSAA